MPAVRSAATGTLSAEAVRAIALGAAVRGVPPDELCRRFDIDPALVADVDARVPVALVVALWEQVPALVGDDDFGLHLAELAAAGPLGLGGHLIASASDLARGLERVLRFERVFHDVKGSDLVIDGDEARLIHDTVRLTEGVVSTLRAYRPAELRALVEDLDDGYEWEAGMTRDRGGTITWVGRPTGAHPSTP